MVAALATIEAGSGAVAVLVNNAGYSQTGAVEAVPLERLRAQFETNVFGLVRLTQLVLPGMRRRGWGRIINLSSMGGKLVFPGGGAYHATKHALEAISDALRFEVKGFGIDVVIVEPGLIKSGFAEAAAASIGEGGAVAALYAPFHAAVATATKESYDVGPLSKLTGVPDDVAAVIERAITVTKPKTRYTVSASATLLLTQRRLLSDRLWDAFLRTSFPTPQPAPTAG
jgi:NAD(P)-dependent dehydrogenase (short-subunit alcohol dehydrogenase family)